MARLLFWNVQKKTAADVIAQIVSAKQADVIALAEADHLEDEVLSRSLRAHCQRTFRPAIGAFTVRVFSSRPAGHVRIRTDKGGLVVASLRQVFSPDLTVAFAHLTSKMGTTAQDLAMLATRLRSSIENAEELARHSRTIVMGDLNMEPHESGVLSSEALHATMSMKIARGRSRIVLGAERRFFYNPMWNLLGDQTKGPPGTFYRQRSAPEAQFWHMIDQVLLRPDAIDLVDLNTLAILTGTATLHLARPDGRPDQQYSDHFPIYIETNDSSDKGVL